MALRRASTAAAAQSARQAVPLLLALLALLTGCCGEAAFGAATGAGPEELMGPSRRLAATHSGHGAPAPPFYPPDAEQIAMYIVIAVALIIAASGGVGGGPILVPVYLLLGRFSNTTAVALSNASIFAASVANVLLVVPRRRHPSKDRPLVAWDLIMLLQPPTAIGAMWGAYVNKVVPVWIAQVLLALMLTFMSWRITNRAMFIFKKESAAQAAAGGAPAVAEGGARKGKGGRAGRHKDSGKGKGHDKDAGLGEEVQKGKQQQPPPPPPQQQQQQQQQQPEQQEQPPKQRKEQEHKQEQEQAQPQEKAEEQEDQQQVLEQQMKEQAGAPAGTKTAASLVDPKRSEAAGGGAAASRPVSRSTSEGDATATIVAAAASGDSGGTGSESCSDSEGESEGEGAGSRPAGAGAAPAVPVETAGLGLRQWASRDLPTLEIDIVTAGSGLWSMCEAMPAVAGDEGDAHAPGARQAAADASPRPSTPPPTPPPPPSEAESRLAYAPPEERPEGDCDPDVGGGAVRGVPVGGPTSAGEGGAAGAAEGAGAPLPAPEVAEERLASDLRRVLKGEARQVPPWHAAGLLLMCGTLLVTTLFSKLQPCGGARFWGIQAAAVPVLLGLAVAARRYVLRKARVKKAAQVDWTGEIKWTRRNTVLFPAISVMAGVIAGVFGLGGGIVFTPLMVKTHAERAAQRLAARCLGATA
ncbi:hypothetical protein MNEG_4647 [Monoraphidium neglectum]|uniref:Uncharacterized protein n=1 Tax=Monoraphidium neglectum TaxID=145388 RepID=A0A0D2MJZ5_9CHLO|nr:hypothetical protein MNEG_4647 [Monoraphidium neglectum]KIZ03310.1 hypothetical protein MNEG_4647 [Monoraphidium neglectum]|eukprot:XP_013902329.1 hypothetical protein MNEG_4647 [Monoraphidium neglectum]